MFTLGIDTVFHSACVSIVQDDRVLCNLIKKTPVSSSRKKIINFSFNNVEIIGSLIKKALKEAKLSIEQISLISVTNDGSLFSNVIVGVSAANTLANVYNIPVIGVDHHEAHIFSNWIENDERKFEFPILIFSASGAHTSISLMNEEKKYTELFCNKGMMDIACKKPNFVGIGTLFSDVSLMLGLRRLNSPGNDGELVSKVAEKGDSSRFDFYENFSSKDLDFWDFNEVKEYITKRIKTTLKEDEENNIFNIAASFELFIAKLITNSLLKAAQKYSAKEIHLVGGVASNNFLRKYISSELLKDNIVVRYPAKKYCTDNAAMIAVLGKMKFSENKDYNKKSVEVKSDLVLDKVAIDQIFKNNYE